ncbi:pimeloyl-ACP methyl ester carboxylesterase [Rhodococcus sp. PvR044]|uniref:alpha/beta fold hydrolase n=1 Tax=Rhodococcus TaxID=1827 RepID=UPI000BD419F6|nr:MULTISPECIES: alpha/beta hydrolase [Rhodococcus]MBP1160687.1 pimeloyl-ACP methyl ester carboxylesterase [Rhodococcus sp. PvR099]MCZ4556432.1 alpha/beta hydrolase [Rhodococcus maanshanensis]PTR43000.1 pimeloyl-ACP methyl ester carboxylesterase [Rhodococcus sp. OK611]SNX91335.1 Pimeloyl-ACP methyl ester carboxylesterase [Rhodococcus sp. OK270]
MRATPGGRLAALRFAAAVLGVTASLIACGSQEENPAGNTVPTADTPQADIARTFDIGDGRQMYLECRGTASRDDDVPTVVLVPGAVAAADTWSEVADQSGDMVPSGSAVYPEVGAFTRVCSYDRPGTARAGDEFTPSTPVSQPTDPERDTADLHALLTAAEVPGPYVLVGWSYGGPIARVYAGTHPDETAGLVLVDGMSEFLENELTPAEFSVFLRMNELDNERRTAQWADVEQLDPAAIFPQLRAAPPVPEVPVVVLSGDTFDPDAFRARLPADAPADYPEVFWRAQLASQDSLALLFPGAQHITKTNSGHNIHNESPQLVVDAIREVVTAAGG